MVGHMNIRAAHLILLLALAGIAGCNWADGLRNAAAVEHNCPVDRVEVLSDDGNGMARTVQLDVCGQQRVYRDMGGARAVVWVDVTSTSGGESPPATPPAPPAQVAVAATAPADFPAFVRSRIDANGARVLACTGADSGAVEAAWTEAGTVTFALRGEADSAIGECVSAAVGAISVPAGAAPGHLIHPLAR